MDDPAPIPPRTDRRLLGTWRSDGPRTVAEWPRPEDPAPGISVFYFAPAERGGTSRCNLSSNASPSRCTTWATSGPPEFTSP